MIRSRIKDKNYVLLGYKNEKTIVTEIKYSAFANCDLGNSAFDFISL
jgi:hypothetical protein